MNTTFYSGIIKGITPELIPIDINVLPAKSGFSVLGLRFTQEKSFKTRIESAFFNNGIEVNDEHFVINIPMAEFNSDTHYELAAIAGLLNMMGKIPKDIYAFLKESIILGNISLDGTVRPVRGCVSFATSLKKLGKKRIIIPSKNLEECSILPNIEVWGISHINQLMDISQLTKPQPIVISGSVTNELDMDQVHGQQLAKRALQIAAAGNHHLLLYGCPGSGKTMLAQRLPTIMPYLTDDEIVECTEIYSVANLLKEYSFTKIRPFRSPHHSSTPVGLLGGGSNPYPGEITLAHNGVLFLDEFLEMRTPTIDMLRQVLEDKKINIKKSNYAVTFPSNFLLVAALNPCPCGFYGSQRRKCNCSVAFIRNYLRKLSGPIIDRIDMQIGIQQIDINESLAIRNISSQEIKISVDKAVEIQRKRNHKGKLNGSLLGHHLELIINLDRDAKEFISNVFTTLNISMRAYHKILRLSRTIADLEGKEKIEKSHIKEALLYRSFDKFVERINNVIH